MSYENLQEKKQGFMLVESLVSVVILGLTVATITQVLFVRFKRMHYSSDAIVAQLILVEKMQNLLRNPNTDLPIKEDLATFDKYPASLEISENDIHEESGLYSFRKLIKPICGTIKVKLADGTEAPFKLLNIKLLSTNGLNEKK